jgi:hypothetical protein
MCFRLPVMNVAAPKITLPVSIVRVNLDDVVGYHYACDG